jgi:hypothetical protein
VKSMRYILFPRPFKEQIARAFDPYSIFFILYSVSCNMIEACTILVGDNFGYTVNVSHQMIHKAKS